MNGKVGGQRPRPRVALLGAFGKENMMHFRAMFPTVWPADSIYELEKKVDVREIDLLIIASKIDDASDWPKKTHVICFSKDIGTLPGPLLNSYIEISGCAETEEFVFPDATLSMDRRRNADYCNMTSVRGWPKMGVRYSYLFGGNKEKATSIFNDGAIICERQTKSPLAVAFIREDNNLGVAWLPRVGKSEYAWVDLIVTEWAEYDKNAFGEFGEWTDWEEWMVAEEVKILSKIQALEDKKKESVTKFDRQICEWSDKLAIAKAEANNGARRLITKQGDELVDEVAKALSTIGFSVTKADELIAEKEPKREDLRLKHVSESGEEWNAIVEVRGYAHSGGKTSDLIRINRFAKLYEKETGKAPDKCIYIVNGQIELPSPNRRQEPFVSNTEDLDVFRSDSNGIVIWSIDLFRAMKGTVSNDRHSLLESIKCTQGRWVVVIGPFR